MAGAIVAGVLVPVGVVAVMLTTMTSSAEGGLGAASIGSGVVFAAAAIGFALAFSWTYRRSRRRPARQ